MHEIQCKFLEAVLGVNGAAIMSRLADSSEIIKTAAVPRTIMSWLGSMEGYNDKLPGSEINLKLVKSESGFYVEFNGIETEEASIEKAAAVIAVGLGVTSGMSKFKDVDLAKLGKTIDLLVKAQKGLAGGQGGGLAQGHHPSVGSAGAVTGEMNASVGPIKPDAPDKAIPTNLKNLSNKAPKMALSEEESEKVCKVCKGKQKDKKGQIKGCHCFTDLSGTLEVKKSESGYEVTFGVGWDDAAISIFTNRVKTDV
jgi:hypothetical protein